MEVAASIPAPRRCQPRQLVSSRAPSVVVLAPRSTLPRHLPAFAAPSCPSRLRGGDRRVHGVRASESADAPALGPSWRPPRGPPWRLEIAGAPPAQLQSDVRGRAARVSSGGDREQAAAPRPPPRFLCLHGFRTSGEIMRRQVVGRWAPEVTARLDLVFADGPFPAEGASPVAGVFDPPYYEWCQFAGEDFLSCRSLDGCFSYLEAVMAREGPFDGLLGFSQGAGVSAVLPGLQQQGLASTGIAKVKCVIVIAGAKIRAPVAVARAFDTKITCPSLHFIGDEDFVKVHSEELVQAFADPLVIRHPCGHTVPKLDEKSLQTMLTYLDKTEREIWEHSSTDTEIMGSN